MADFGFISGHDLMKHEFYMEARVVEKRSDGSLLNGVFSFLENSGKSQVGYYGHILWA